MKIGQWTVAVIAAVSFSGVAQADIAETFSGTIISGTDTAGLFGVQNVDLTGDAVVFSFSYDPALISANATFYTDNLSYEQYFDNSSDGAVTESVTINSRTFALVNNLNPSLGLVAFNFQFPTAVDFEPWVIVGDAYIETGFTSSLTLAPGQYPINDQAVIDTIVHNLIGGTGIYLSDANGNTEFLSTNLAAMPEPSTWVALALELGAVFLLLFWRRVSRCPSPLRCCCRRVRSLWSPLG